MPAAPELPDALSNTGAAQCILRQEGGLGPRFSQPAFIPRCPGSDARLQPRTLMRSYRPSGIPDTGSSRLVALKALKGFRLNPPPIHFPDASLSQRAAAREARERTLQNCLGAENSGF